MRCPCSPTCSCRRRSRRRRRRRAHRRLLGPARPPPPPPAAPPLVPARRCARPSPRALRPLGAAPPGTGPAIGRCSRRSSGSVKRRAAGRWSRAQRPAHPSLLGPPPASWGRSKTRPPPPRRAGIGCQSGGGARRLGRRLPGSGGSTLGCALLKVQLRELLTCLELETVGSLAKRHLEVSDPATLLPWCPQGKGNGGLRLSRNRAPKHFRAKLLPPGLLRRGPLPLASPPGSLRAGDEEGDPCPGHPSRFSSLLPSL